MKEDRVIVWIILILLFVGACIVVTSDNKPYKLPADDYKIVHIRWKNQKVDCIRASNDGTAYALTCDFPPWRNFA